MCHSGWNVADFIGTDEHRTWTHLELVIGAPHRMERREQHWSRRTPNLDANNTRRHAGWNAGRQTPNQASWHDTQCRMWYLFPGQGTAPLYNTKFPVVLSTYYDI